MLLHDDADTSDPTPHYKPPKCQPTRSETDYRIRNKSIQEHASSADGGKVRLPPSLTVPCNLSLYIAETEM